MRLTALEANIIKQSVLKHAPDAEVYLFGSRVDDTALGGDIDVLAITKYHSLKTKLKIKREFFKRLEDQKIDLILAPDKQASSFVRLAVQEAQAL